MSKGMGVVRFDTGLSYAKVYPIEGSTRPMLCPISEGRQFDIYQKIRQRYNILRV